MNCTYSEGVRHAVLGLNKGLEHGNGHCGGAAEVSHHAACVRRVLLFQLLVLLWWWLLLILLLARFITVESKQTPHYFTTRVIHTSHRHHQVY